MIDQVLKFFTLFMIIITLFGCSNNEIEREKLLPLKAEYERFFNEFLFKELKNQSILPQSLVIEPKELKEVLNSVDFINSQEIEGVLINLDTCKYLFDCKRLVNTQCIDEAIMDSLLSIKDSLLETDSGLMLQNPWIEFSKYYGNSGINKYSIPIFIKNKKVAVIKHFAVAEVNTGFCEYYFFEKKDSNWKFVKSFNKFIM